MAIVSRELDRALRRRFALFDRLGALDRRGMHLIDPWPIGASLGMTHDETEQALATPEGVGWITRNTRDVGERVALTVHGLTRRGTTPLRRHHTQDGRFASIPTSRENLACIRHLSKDSTS